MIVCFTLAFELPCQTLMGSKSGGIHELSLPGSPSTDLFKCTVQMEADLTPFRWSWSVYEYLALCGRPFLDRHSGCVKPAKGSCPTQGFNGVSECPFRSFHTLTRTPVMEGCARVLALFIVSCCFYTVFLAWACATLQAKRTSKSTFSPMKMCRQSFSSWQGDERLIRLHNATHQVEIKVFWFGILGISRAQWRAVAHWEQKHILKAQTSKFIKRKLC